MKRFQNVLFHTDGQAGSRFALHRAVELATRNQGRLTVVNVLGDLPRELLRLAAMMPLEDLRSRAMQEVRERLSKFTTENLAPWSHLVKGEAGTVIPQLAGKEWIDLIVMSTLARAGLEGYFIGNTAETVLQRVACSVLTAKPDGFVSPVILD